MMSKTIGKGLLFPRQPLSPVAWDEQSSFTDQDNNSQTDPHAHPNETFRYQLPGDDRSNGGVNNGRIGYADENINPQLDARYWNALHLNNITLIIIVIIPHTHSLHPPTFSS